MFVKKNHGSESVLTLMVKNITVFEQSHLQIQIGGKKFRICKR
jgi:hypothetical protein